MLSFKMPWTRRKERLEKELAEKLELEAKARRKRHEAIRATWMRPTASVANAQPVASNTDTILPAMVMYSLLSSTDSTPVPAASSYCAPNSGASSFSSGDGGDFGGGGASGSWGDSSSSSSSSSSSYDSGSSDSSSSSSFD